MAWINSSFSICGLEEMQKWAEKLSCQLSPGDTVALYGNLGAGKTTLVQMIVPYLTKKELSVTSPTFSYLHIYEGAIPVYHFDLYRLLSLEDFVELGWEEYFQQEGICFIEWPEKIVPLLPEKTLHLTLEVLQKGRKITLKKANL